MFSFFHRTNKIYLDCFTDIPQIFQQTPIVRASKVFPDWWKDLPTPKLNFNYDNTEYVSPSTDSNMRNCFGFLELYKRGIIIESWCDLHIKSSKEEIRYFYSNGKSPGSHNRSQWGEGFKNYHHLKLHSPWFFQEKTGINFLFFGAEWHLEDYDFKIVPGLIRYDLTAGTNVNMMIPAKDTEYFIPMGKPLVHIVPLSDKKIVLKNHLVTTEEFNRKAIQVGGSWHGWRSSIELIYRNRKRNSRCPFGRM